jgi:hypothetical protein
MILELRQLHSFEGPYDQTPFPPFPQICTIGPYWPLDNIEG